METQLVLNDKFYQNNGRNDNPGLSQPEEVACMGSTISLWDCRRAIFNEDYVESAILLPNDKEHMPWSEVLDQDKTYWLCAMTTMEYNRLFGDDGEVTMLHGKEKAGSR